MDIKTGWPHLSDERKEIYVVWNNIFIIMDVIPVPEEVDKGLFVGEYGPDKELHVWLVEQATGHVQVDAEGGCRAVFQLADIVTARSQGGSNGGCGFLQKIQRDFQSLRFK